MLRAALISTVCATPVAAAPMCETRNWAAHTHDHRDLGHGRVAWDWSWELEGIANDIHVVDCKTRAGLKIRARAERMGHALPYDRRVKARRAIDLAASAPHFFSLKRLDAAMEDIHVPTEPFAVREEPCACATYYPGMFDGAYQETRDP